MQEALQEEYVPTEEEIEEMERRGRQFDRDRAYDAAQSSKEERLP